jgi:hypothetical protein
VTATARRKCEGGCGRWLTAAASLAVGYGPDCLRKRAGNASGARAAPQGPGVFVSTCLGSSARSSFGSDSRSTAGPVEG